VNLDASLLEINPLVLTKDGTLVALDAKMTFDDNALFRHKDVAALRDESRGGAGRDAGRRRRASPT
jgi:succinyl-CoA synthetase beta subunit